jgi:hypothetical protein
VFQVVLPASTDDRKRARIRTDIGTCYSTYLQQDQAIRRANRQHDELSLVEDTNDTELSDAELYRTAPAVPNNESELTRYLQQERLLQDTDIYQY